jgi:hypothetical protein
VLHDGAKMARLTITDGRLVCMNCHHKRKQPAGWDCRHKRAVAVSERQDLSEYCTLYKRSRSKAKTVTELCRAQVGVPRQRFPPKSRRRTGRGTKQANAAGAAASTGPATPKKNATPTVKNAKNTSRPTKHTNRRPAAASEPAHASLGKKRKRGRPKKNPSEATHTPRANDTGGTHQSAGVAGPRPGDVSSDSDPMQANLAGACRVACRVGQHARHPSAPSRTR